MPIKAINIENLASVSKRIRGERERLGHTQKQVADLVGAAQSTIARIEQAKAEPTPGLLVRLAKLFDRSIDYLLVGEEWFPISGGPNAVAESSAKYEDSPPDLTGFEVTEVHPAKEPDPKTADLLAKAREVLEAGEDVYGPALEQNIKAFHRSVKGEQCRRSGLMVAQSCVCGRRIEHPATAIIEGDNVVACPTCGRTIKFDRDQIEDIVEDLKAQIRQLREERMNGRDRGAA